MGEGETVVRRCDSSQGGVKVVRISFSCWRGMMVMGEM